MPDRTEAMELIADGANRAGPAVVSITRTFRTLLDDPRGLTAYIKDRQGYDYSHHGRADNPDTAFVPDQTVDSLVPTWAQVDDGYSPVPTDPSP